RVAGADQPVGLHAQLTAQSQSALGCVGQDEDASTVCGVFFLVHDDLAHGPAGVGDTAVVVSGHSWPAAPALTLCRYEGNLCGSVDVVVRGRGERGRPESFDVCKVGTPVQDVGQTFLGHPQD